MNFKILKQKYSWIIVAMLLLCLVGCGKVDKKNNTSENTATATDATLTDIAPEESIPKERTDYETIAESDWLVKDNLVGGTENLYEIVVPEIADTYGKVVDMAAAGDNVIVLYSDKDKNNYLYEIEPYNMYVVREVALPEGKYERGALKLYDDEMYVLDIEDGFAYFYDFEFNKIRDIELPEKATSNMVQSNNNKYIYYYNSQENYVYQVDLITGKETKLIEDINPDMKSVELAGVAGDDQSLLICGYDDSANPIYEVRDIATKEVILEGMGMFSELESINDSYTVRYEEDGFKHVLCGDVSQEEADVICLRDHRSYNAQDERTYDNSFGFVSDKYYSEYIWTFDEQEIETEIYLSMINIHDGSTYITKYPIEGDDYEYKVMTDIVLLEEENLVVYAVYDLSTKIYVLDLDDGKQVDNINNLFDFGDIAHYDEETEEYLLQRAKEVGLKHNVEILIGDEMSYVHIAEVGPDYNAVLINLAINTIEEEYYKYPEGMINQLVSENPLKISLVGRFYDKTRAGVYVGGIGEYSIATSVYSDYNRILHHETFHVIEDYVARVDGTFDTEEWSAFNPEGFQYLYSYNGHEGNDEYVLDYFIQSYGKTFPSEDRATIMEQAMINDAYFNSQLKSEHINAKLAYICEKVRAGFDTTGWPEETYWEKKINK